MINRANVAVGLFSLVVLAALGWYLTFWLERERPMAETLHVEVVYDAVGGLKSGAPVTLQGLAVGRVAGIRIERDASTRRPVFVVGLELQADDRLRNWLRTDSVFSIVTDNLLGERHVDASFGTEEGSVLRDGQRVVGARSPGFNELLESLEGVVRSLGGVAEAGGAGGAAGGLAEIGRAATNIADVADELRDLARTADGADGSLRRGIQDLAVAAQGLAEVLGGERADRLGAAADSFAAAAEGLERTVSDLRSWVDRPESDPRRTLEDLNAAASNLRTITAKVRQWVERPSRLFWGGDEDEGPDNQR